MGNPDDGMTSLLMTDGATTNVMEAAIQPRTPRDGCGDQAFLLSAEHGK